MTLAGSDDALGGVLAALVLGRVRPATRTSDESRRSRITLTGIVEKAGVLLSDDPGVAGVDGTEAADSVAGAAAADGAAAAGAADGVAGADAADCVEDVVVCGMAEG